MDSKAKNRYFKFKLYLFGFLTCQNQISLDRNVEIKDDFQKSQISLNITEFPFIF